MGINMPIRVYIYLVVHTLLSAAMFWLYSKEYESLGTRLYVTFGTFSSVWTMFLWLRLPFFTVLGVVVTFFNVSVMGAVVLFSLLVLFCIVLLAFVNGGIITGRSRSVTSHRKYHLSECTF